MAEPRASDASPAKRAGVALAVTGMRRLHHHIAAADRSADGAGDETR